MGLFDRFRKADSAGKAASKTDKELARLSRIVADKYSQNYDRQEAISELARIGGAGAARHLLRRFNFSMAPSTPAPEEKESAAGGVVSEGEEALGPLREYCVKAESLRWPLEILREIVAEHLIAEEMLSLLDQFDTEYTRNSEPKVQLLNALENYPGTEVREAIEPFLLDVNESVRFHAVGAIFSMASPESMESLVEAMEEEESLRVRNRVASALVEQEWELSEELGARLSPTLPPKFALSDSRRVVSTS